MNIHISPLKPEDVEDIVRKVDLPAIQDSPLHRRMFPSESTVEQHEQIVQWYAEGLTDNNSLVQICSLQGRPVGFCGWVMKDRGLTSRETGAKKTRKKLVLPDALDISAWLSVSSDLRKETERALEGLDWVCCECWSFWAKQFLQDTDRLTRCVLRLDLNIDSP